jgi:XTP/dITP diphosphohydrolase
VAWVVCWAAAVNNEPPMKLLYATTNQGKLAEAKQILNGVDLLSLSDFPAIADLDVEESGKTFQENAFIKAKTYGDLAGVLTVGEDAGLCVDALDGAPGVYSARYAPTPEARNEKLLQALEGVDDRSAQFKTVLCLYDPKTKTAEYFDGIVEGAISDEVKGDNGFGYDPVFVPDGYTETFAELGNELKNTLSHRFRAIEKLKKNFML